MYNTRFKVVLCDSKVGDVPYVLVNMDGIFAKQKGINFVVTLEQ